MRIIMLTVSGLVSLIFLLLFIGSFAAEGKIHEVARNLVVEKTAKYSEKGVSAAEELIESPLSKKFLSEKHREAVTDEIEAYRADPIAFVRRMTSETAPPEPQGKLSKLRGKFLGWKDALRKHYNKSLNELLSDLRLFCATNVVAGILGMLLSYISRGKKARVLLIYCVILLFAIGSAIQYYIDSMGFFKILIGGYIGWDYPLLILITFVATYWYIGRHAIAMIDAVERAGEGSSKPSPK
ncbi:MAG: hypothetical protein L3J39_19575 [Verrucomicrobiales bacterium]|nr:hypothetical protein [Verrucomicrobiales bacterium]